MKTTTVATLLFLTACTTVNDSVFPPLYYGPNNISIGDARLRVRQYVRENTFEKRFPDYSHACQSIGIYGLNVQPINYPFETCRRDAELYAKEINVAIKEKAEEEDKEKIKKQQDELSEKLHQEELNKAAKEADNKRKSDDLKIAIKTGKKQPESTEEAAILYDAKDGEYLASSPKIKPDNAFYAIDGAINFMESDDIFIGQLLTSMSYFKVRIPENLRSEFESTAKIKGWFSIVGKYTKNSEVTLFLGQIAQVPVFEAVYFKAITFNKKQ